MDGGRRTAKKMNRRWTLAMYPKISKGETAVRRLSSAVIFAVRR
jgi:hypothetical protein